MYCVSLTYAMQAASSPSKWTWGFRIVVLTALQIKSLLKSTLGVKVVKQNGKITENLSVLEQYSIVTNIQNGPLNSSLNDYIVTYVYASKSPVLMLSINCSVILMISCRRAGTVNRSMNQSVRAEVFSTPIGLTDILYGTNTVACTLFFSSTFLKPYTLRPLIVHKNNKPYSRN
ncbi:hypothetical protein ALC53_12235 [Atta colombica]|uniref:Uncharacterized protein n=1 Tax=Atta colombica TaxID=520822 RepID=A0A195AZ71_9HYME|nr:hypothetical protein ALC53_12235 [Atta colombica]